jgi:RNase P/RNase MRP subunit p29
MISIRFSRKHLNGSLGGVALCFALSLSAAAQVQTQRSETHGPATKEVKVERGEIVYVSGNSVVVKMEDGTLRHFDNVPESTTVTVDGRQLNVHQLQVGMKVEKQTITTTTPKTITTVKTVTGTVWHVTPPASVILTLENGQNQEFKIPQGQKFNVDGQMVDAFGLKKGMKVEAQKVVEEPEIVVAQEVKRTGTAPPAPPAPKADVPMLIVLSPPTPAPAAPVATAAAEPAPKKLPKTASNVPLVGLLGVLLCAVSLTGMAIRKFSIRTAV